MSSDPDLPARIDTTDGVTLEVAWSAPASPRAVAVLTHPHPQYGGDMHNLVPATFARVLPDQRIAALRFNFRGTGASTGSHGGGEAEIADVRAAVDAATAAFPGTPVVGIGYSFGADVLLGLDDDRLSAVVAIAPPLAVLSDERLAAPRADAPTLVLSAEHDQIRNVDAALPVVGTWPNTTLVPVEGTDHFLAGAMDRITTLTLDFLTPLLL